MPNCPGIGTIYKIKSMVKTENNHLHIFNDEKFTNLIVDQFIATEVPNQTFVLIQEVGITKMNYPVRPDLPVKIIQRKSDAYNELISSLYKHKSIFIHYLCDLKMEFIEKAPLDIRIVWMCWGQDIHKLVIAKSYLPETKFLLWKNKKYSDFCWEYTLFIRQLKFPFSRKGKLLKRIDYCCPVIKEDLTLIRKRLKLDIQYIPFHYSTLEDILGDQIGSVSQGNNILVGNSGSYASNHLDAFKKLGEFNLEKRQVVVPLSYGDEIYAKQIRDIGYNLFSDYFFPIMDFLTIDKYNKILSGCSVAIFNHLRQHALANILVCLWLGLRVYMNNKSPLYNNLKELGLNIYSIKEDLRLENPLALGNMLRTDVDKNKLILFKEFGRMNTINLTKQIFKIIT